LIIPDSKSRISELVDTKDTRRKKSLTSVMTKTARGQKVKTVFVQSLRYAKKFTPGIATAYLQ
jgi:hypothetical protein